VLEFYNVTAKEDDEDSKKIKIPEIEGHRVVQGPHNENPDIIAPLEMKQVNISMEV